VLKSKYKKIRKSGVLYDYTPMGIIVVGMITIAFLVLTSLLFYLVFTFGRGIGNLTLNAQVGYFN
jgi:hypothetical protein